MPKNSTSKEIWKYLSTSNLLDNIEDVELTDENKITSIEKATHENNYTEKLTSFNLLSKRNILC